MLSSKMVKTYTAKRNSDFCKPSVNISKGRRMTEYKRQTYIQGLYLH